jgi:hypothetical protein
MRPLLVVIVLMLPAVAQAGIVYLPTQPGAERFRQAAIEPAALALFGFVEAETRLSFCGPASLAAVLYSLGISDPTQTAMFPYHLVTQESVFTPENQAVKAYPAVERSGLTLDQLSKLPTWMRPSA